MTSRATDVLQGESSQPMPCERPQVMPLYSTCYRILAHSCLVESSLCSSYLLTGSGAAEKPVRGKAQLNPSLCHPMPLGLSHYESQTLLWAQP